MHLDRQVVTGGDVLDVAQVRGLVVESLQSISHEVAQGKRERQCQAHGEAESDPESAEAAHEIVRLRPSALGAHGRTGYRTKDRATKRSMLRRARASCYNCRALRGSSPLPQQMPPRPAPLATAGGKGP